MTENKTAAREKFLGLLHAATRDGTLVKLTLGKPRVGTAEPSLKNLFVRPVALKSGPHLSLVWRHATRDITKNFSPRAALAQLNPLIGTTFLDAHLFTPAQTAQFETGDDGHGHLRVKTLSTAPAPASEAHDHAKSHPIPADAPWLRALGVTDEHGRPRKGMADKFRQIEKFAELLTHLLAETEFSGRPRTVRPRTWAAAKATSLLPPRRCSARAPASAASNAATSSSRFATMSRAKQIFQPRIYQRRHHGRHAARPPRRAHRAPRLRHSDRRCPRPRHCVRCSTPRRGAMLPEGTSSATDHAARPCARPAPWNFSGTPRRIRN